MPERVNVRMLTYDQVAASSFPAPAFSNGFEGDRWTGRWCETCKHDEFFGALGATGVTECPIIGVTMIGEQTPREMTEVALGGLEYRYDCAGYEVREGAEDARDGLPSQ